MMMIQDSIFPSPSKIMTISYFGEYDDDNDDDEKDNTFPSPLYNEARWRVY